MLWIKQVNITLWNKTLYIKFLIRLATQISATKKPHCILTGTGSDTLPQREPPSSERTTHSQEDKCFFECWISRCLRLSYPWEEFSPDSDNLLEKSWSRNFWMNLPCFIFSFMDFFLFLFSYFLVVTKKNK